MIKKAKGIVDVTMTIVFVILMGYHLFGGVLHEWLGIGVFMFCIIHQIVNRNWYYQLGKGVYTYQRYLLLLLNFVFVIAFLITIVSGILISNHILLFLKVENMMLVRKLHMLGSTWTYLLMTIHLGFHITYIKNCIWKWKISNNLRKAIGACIVLYGCYVFLQRGLLEDMFLKNDFKFLPYGEEMIHFMIDYMAILMTGTAIGYALLHKKRWYRKQDS